MPLNICEINGNQGYKWGSNGRCYQHNGTERSKALAKKKAIAQGVAIGDYKSKVNYNVSNIDLEKLRVSFDYDGTLTEEKWQNKAKEFLAEGDQVFILTARSRFDMEPVGKLAKEIGISMDNIYYTSGRDKWPWMEKLNINMHYDNNKDQVDLINEKTNAEGILV